LPKAIELSTKCIAVTSSKILAGALEFSAKNFYFFLKKYALSRAPLQLSAKLVFCVFQNS
jgi:hypothetical protein